MPYPGVMRRSATTSLGSSTPNENTLSQAGSNCMYTFRDVQNHFLKLGTPNPLTSIITTDSSGAISSTHAFFMFLSLPSSTCRKRSSMFAS